MPIGPVFPEFTKLHAVAAVWQLRAITGLEEEGQRLREATLDRASEAVTTDRAPLQACHRVARSLHRQEAVRDERRRAGCLSIACLGATLVSESLRPVPIEVDRLLADARRRL